jgi:hydrogenase-4 component J
MEKRAVFYQLTHKLVNSQERIPEDARQVIYYSLAIGHHMGVLDCFKSMMEISLEDYSRWIGHLPECNGRKKMEGLLEWGEIELNSSHANDLLSMFRTALPRMNASELNWSNQIMRCMQQMVEEPAYYLMIRTRP